MTKTPVRCALPFHLSATDFKIADHDNATKLQEVKNELSDTQSKLLSAKNKMEDIARYIQQLESRQRKLCISHRANTAISSIKKHYAKVSKTIGDKDIKDLKVFPVSAQAYTERLNGQFVEGYVDGADTGIPGFIQWLIESTLKGRSQNSQAILKGLVDLEESIMSTLADSAMGQKISKKDAKKVMSSFGQKMATLQEVSTNNRSYDPTDAVVATRFCQPRGCQNMREAGDDWPIQQIPCRAKRCC